MAKNIVVCCDGTGNQIDKNLTNVLKLFRIASKNDSQRVYYDAGVGTIGSSDTWSRWRQNIKSVFQLATGQGLDNDILGAYEFICRTYEEGDDIFLFGFSRGAYSARAVAGMIHLMGVLRPDLLNNSSYAVRAYKQSSSENDLRIAWQFADVTSPAWPKIKFLGVWDTVASVIVPDSKRLTFSLQTLPYTRQNPSVEVFRHAIAIDERRRMFRLNHWIEGQTFKAKRFSKTDQGVPQDCKQVWFSGVHADVGGGYAEAESGLAKFPLDWMIGEAKAQGLKISTSRRNELALGRKRANSQMDFVPADANAMQHDPMNWAWKIVEYWPKKKKYQEGASGNESGRYLPRSEPRLIACRDADRNPVKPLIHQSVLARWQLCADYRPVNFPGEYDIEPWPYDGTAFALLETQGH